MAGRVVGEDVEVSARALQRHGLLRVELAALVVERQAFHARQKTIVVEAGDEDVLLGASLRQRKVDLPALVGLKAGDGEEPLRAEALGELGDGRPGRVRAQGGEAADLRGGAHHAEPLQRREVLLLGRQLLDEGPVDLVPELARPARDPAPVGFGRRLVGGVPEARLGLVPVLLFGVARSGGAVPFRWLRRGAALAEIFLGEDVCSTAGGGRGVLALDRGGGRGVRGGDEAVGGRGGVCGAGRRVGRGQRRISGLVFGLWRRGGGFLVFGRGRLGQEGCEAAGTLGRVEREQPLVQVHTVGEEADRGQAVLRSGDPAGRFGRRPEHVGVGRGVGVGDVGNGPAAKVRALELQEGISRRAIEHLRGGARPEALAAHDGAHGEAALGGDDRAHRPLADREELVGPKAGKDVEVVAGPPQGHVLAVLDLPHDPALDGRDAPPGVVVRDEDVVAGEGELDTTALPVLGESGHGQERLAAQFALENRLHLAGARGGHGAETPAPYGRVREAALFQVGPVPHLQGADLEDPLVRPGSDVEVTVRLVRAPGRLVAAAGRWDVGGILRPPILAPDGHGPGTARGGCGAVPVRGVFVVLASRRRGGLWLVRGGAAVPFPRRGLRAGAVARVTGGLLQAEELVAPGEHGEEIRLVVEVLEAGEHDEDVAAPGEAAVRNQAAALAAGLHDRVLLALPARGAVPDGAGALVFGRPETDREELQRPFPDQVLVVALGALRPGRRGLFALSPGAH